VILRRTLFQVAALTGALVLVAGCTGGDDGAPTGGGALAEVRAAAEKTAGTSHRVTLSAGEVDATGVVDPGGRALSLDITSVSVISDEPVTRRIRVVGDDAYLTLGETALDLDPDKYIRFETADLAGASSSLDLADPFDPAGLQGLAAAFTSAERADGGRFTGVLDLTKAPDDTSRGFLPADQDQLAGGGDVVTRIPFEAAADGEGYLTSLTVRVPSFDTIQAYDSETTFAGFGEPVDVKQPKARDIADVPDEFREMLAS
jgi:hypothetical protein